MFHFTSPSQYSSPFSRSGQSPYHRHHQSLATPTPVATSFEEYDLQRSYLEREALLQRQQKRRQVEQEQFYLHQRQLAREVLLKKEQQKKKEELILQRMLAQEEVEEDRREAVAEYRKYLHAVAQLQQHQLEQQFQQERQQALQQQQQQQSQEQVEQEPVEYYIRFNPLSYQHHSSTSAPVSIPITTPTPAPTLTAEELEAQATLQRNLESHVLRRQTLSQLSSLSDSLKSHQSTFVFPSTLIFNPSPPSSSSTEEDTTTSTATLTSPKLAYSSKNSTFLAYEDFLVGLLSKVDEVESKGDGIVKSARKELVREIEEELKKLDEGKERVWKENLERLGSQSVEDIVPTTSSVDSNPLASSSPPLASPSPPAVVEEQSTATTLTSTSTLEPSPVLPPTSITTQESATTSTLSSASTPIEEGHSSTSAVEIEVVPIEMDVESGIDSKHLKELDLGSLKDSLLENEENGKEAGEGFVVL